MYNYIGKGVARAKLGSNTELSYIQNRVVMNHAIKRFLNYVKSKKKQKSKKNLKPSTLWSLQPQNWNNYSSFLSVSALLALSTIVTRDVRGSDYSPTTVLSEEKDKLVPENWRDRQKKYQRIIPKPQTHLHSIQKTSAKFQNNWRKTVRGVVPTRYPLSIYTLW